MGEVVEIIPFSTSASSVLTSLYSYFHAFLDVHHHDARAVAGTVFRNIGEVQHAEIAHTLFEMPDFGVDVALALFGVFVLGVLRKVAVRAGDGNSLGRSTLSSCSKESISCWSSF